MLKKISTLFVADENLSLHPHIHCLIADGGLSGNGQWIKPRRAILFPAGAMMQLFRGKLISALRASTELTLPDNMSRSQYRALLNKLRKTDWVVHCCKPYAHGGGVMTYLSRYVKGAAFKNNQLHLMDNGRIRFGYQSHQTGRRAQARLTIADFILRVCDHIPQKGKPTLRYYGLYHPCCKEKLKALQEQMGDGHAVGRVMVPSWQEYIARFEKLPRCPICEAPLQRQEGERSEQKID